MMTRHGPKVPKFVIMTMCFEHDSMFWNTLSCKKHISAYNVFCKVNSNFNSFQKFKTRSQFISTRTSTKPDIWKCHHTDFNNGLDSGCPAQLFTSQKSDRQNYFHQIDLTTIIYYFCKEHPVPFWSSNYCFKSPCSNKACCEVLSTRESDTTTESHFDCHCNKLEKVQDDWIGMSKIVWVCSLLFCPEQN